jgi:hypothetical protein
MASAGCIYLLGLVLFDLHTQEKSLNLGRLCSLSMLSVMYPE